MYKHLDKTLQLMRERNDPDLKKEYHRAGRAILKALADAMGLDRDAYDLSNHVAGSGVCGGITLHTEQLYLCIDDDGYMPVLFRTCDGRNDYQGHDNHWAPLAALQDVDRFAEYLALVIAGTANGNIWNEEQVRSDLAHHKADKLDCPTIKQAQEDYEWGRIEIDEFELALQLNAPQQNVSQMEMLF